MILDADDLTWYVPSLCCSAQSGSVYAVNVCFGALAASLANSSLMSAFEHIAGHSALSFPKLQAECPLFPKAVVQNARNPLF